MVVDELGASTAWYAACSRVDKEYDSESDLDTDPDAIEAPAELGGGSGVRGRTGRESPLLGLDGEGKVNASEGVLVVGTMFSVSFVGDWESRGGDVDSRPAMGKPASDAERDTETM